jgi:predicted P-loop ATPase
MTPLESARWWVKRGFHPSPVPNRSKKPVVEGWPSLRLTEVDLPRYFDGKAQNIGIILGDESGSTDVDLDCAEALAIAHPFLPETNLVFGRASRPASHYIYRCDPPVVSLKFSDPIIVDKNENTLVELRCRKKDDTAGFQTVVPESVHESGELIRFEPGRNGYPANIDAETLVKAVQRVAAASLLSRYWPHPKAGRNDAFLALAGTFARGGWSVEEAIDFNFALYKILWGNQADRPACVSEVRPTFEKYAAGLEITGIPKLKNLIDERVVRAAFNWIGISQTAAEPVAEGHPNNWRAMLVKSDKGKQLPVVANALIALRYAPEWKGVLAFNQSSLETVVRVKPPWPDSRAVPFPWRDEDDVLTAAWLQHQGILAATQTAGQAVQTIAREHPFHPVRDYINSLVWDKVPRIDRWLSTYLGVVPSDLSYTFGAKWLIGAVARVLRPGCKNDHCLILEGEQGILKSTALRTLTEPWFTDDMPQLGTKDAALQTRGVWLIELSELDAMARSEVSHIKAFMSRETDRFRPPFGRRPIDVPRECVFAGTVNHSNYLRDETGGRRFWPVRCGTVSIAELKRDRDQLWAEARDRFNAGETWWLDKPAMIAAATIEQEDRYEGGVWDEPIYAWIEGRTSVSIEEILELCIKKPQAQWTQSDRICVARSLRAAHWARYKTGPRSAREWRYKPPVTQCPSMCPGPEN